MRKPLREKLGDEALDSLVELINQSQSEQKKDILEFVEE
ncbi:MAG: LA_3696 family protein, partial [bacterium]